MVRSKSVTWAVVCSYVFRGDERKKRPGVCVKVEMGNREKREKEKGL